jgi:hypothetical protein
VPMVFTNKNVSFYSFQTKKCDRLTEYHVFEHRKNQKDLSFLNQGFFYFSQKINDVTVY